ncbi:MAG: hypothetical protein AAF492_24250, partial [Verrucomicrobiota bacterium]
APTSLPYPTPPLSPEEAAEYVRAFQPLPVPGQGWEAVKQVAEALEGDSAYLVVCAPRSESLWAEASEVDLNLPLHIYDTSETRLQSFVRKAEPNTDAEGKAGLNVYLGGDASTLVGRRVTASRGNTWSTEKKVTATDALTGRIQLSRPATGSEQPIEVGLKMPDAHPWSTYYLDAGQEPEARPAVLIVRPRTERAQTITRILTATLEAVEPGLEVVWTTPGGSPAELPSESFSGLIWIGGGKLSGGMSAWLNRRLRSGIMVLCFPESMSGLSGTARSHPMLPGFRPAPPAASGTGLTLAGNAAAIERSFEDLLLAGLKELRFPQWREPVFSSGGIPVLLAGSTPVLTARSEYGHTLIWAMGSVPSMKKDSPVFHPLYPLLLQRILFPPRAHEAGSGRVPFVGDAVRVNRWLGKPAHAGTLTFPDGTEMAMPDRVPDDFSLTLTQAGRHVVQTP